MIRALVQNPRVAALLTALLLVSGLSALSNLPRTEDPNLTNRVAAVITPYPGATAERVEALVTEPLEASLRQLDEIKNLTSTSRPGISVVTIELQDRVMDADPVWSRARDLIADTAPTLPQGTASPTLDDQLAYAFTRIFAFTWQGQGQADATILGRYADELASRLRLVPGTDFVKVLGKMEEEILVSIDDAELYALGLSIDDLAAQIRAADSKTASGNLEGNRIRAQLEVSGELVSLNRIRQVPLRPGDQLQTLRVMDVASVSRSAKWPPQELVLSQGQQGVLVAVRMLPDTRIDRWNDQVEQTLAQLTPLLSGNVSLDTLFNQQGYTEIRLSELVGNLGLGFMLILAVLLVTLGWRSALLVAFALPVTVLFTLFCMQLYGLPIHQMSVTGLVVALGIMVDNAIVVVDAIGQRRSRGMSGVEAVTATVRQFWLPLLSSTLTTVLAFAPIFLMPGPAGEFVGGIALAVSFALVGSYLVSLTLIAGLGGRFIGPRQGNHWWQQGITLPWLGQALRRTLAIALAWPKLTLLAMLMMPATGFWAAGQMTEQFFPAADRDMFHIEVFMPQQASLPNTVEAVSELDNWLRQQAGIEQTSWTFGRNSPSFYYNLLQRRRGAANYAQGMITATDFEVANRLIPQLQKQLDSRHPQMQILVRKLEQGPPFNAPIELRVYGPELDQLTQLGDQLRLLLNRQPDITQTRATLTSGAARVKLAIDEEASLANGLTLSQVAGQLRASMDGVVGGTVLEGVENLPVRVRLNARDRNQAADLGSVQLISASANPTMLPLSAVSQMSIESGRAAIPRRNGQRINSIEGYLVAGVLPSKVLDEIDAELAQFRQSLPAGYRLEIGGESAKRDQAVAKLMSSVTIIMVLLISVVVLSFNSFRLTTVILASAGQSAGLGLLSVYLMGFPFGFNVINALMGLAGLAINAAIVILAELEENPQASDGDPQAIIDTVVGCGRHIGSTTITTFGGFLPLILAGGGFWPPFAVAIAGGTLLTTFLSFVFVPACYLLIRGRRRPQPRPALAATA
ncbi:efflux RND transporter permease subunit [Ferrimonas kyonanensis]|uniref:efflux RND transporter permease subunit n=1 Tax=Ferrimonas kyonanensis TaxID=364763 RepID=UPI000411574A|nr:efflux RND transporter permease subunit [Ferrimonas kyonanensis]